MKEGKERERIEAVLQILSKQTPLTLKQEKFCNDACVERFLKWKGDSVKKAAKHLRACLSWRDSIGIDHVMADEFSSELAEGVAYVAGHDDEARPVVVFRLKQYYYKFHYQKSYARLVAFTLEVAISFMSRFVDKMVILFDASFFKSASAFMNLFMVTVKILCEYYPGRLYRAFVVDPPSLFPYLWKGARPFVDLYSSTSVVSSLDYNTFSDDPFNITSSSTFSSSVGTTSLRFDISPIASAAVNPTPPKPAAISNSNGIGSASSRFAFTVSHLDSLKPWYLSRGDCMNSPSLIGACPVSARSFSFASPGTRPTKTEPRTPLPLLPRTPRPGFLPSPTLFLFGRRRKGEEEREVKGFRLYLRFYRMPYDETVYRSKMKPPLGGIVSIVSPHVIRQQRFRHVNHQRF